MSEKKESSSPQSESVPGGSCVVPRGPNAGDIVLDTHSACFPEAEGGQNTVHHCKNGTWENTGDECTPAGQ